jgi:Protein of unknown function (DUF3800)
VVDTFFGKSETQILDFHCLMVDTHRINDRRFNAGSREAGFNKEIYQLLMKFNRLYSRNTFDVYLDERSTPTALSELRTIINHGIRRKYPHRDWPVRRLHFRDSSKTHSLQIVDILLGAIAFRLNGHRGRQGASPAKCELSDFVLARAGISDVIRDTAISGRFTLWHRRLRSER